MKDSTSTSDPTSLQPQATLVREIEQCLSRTLGRNLKIDSLKSSLRDELGLDSMNLIELAVWVHETFQVNLGELAERQGLRFETVEDLVTTILDDRGQK